MTELLDGRPTPRTRGFNALPHASSPLLLFSISGHALINEAQGFGGASKLRRRCDRVKTKRNGKR